MPEIAEVRISRDILQDSLKDQSLSVVNILTGKYSKKAPNNYLDFQKSLPSQIKSVNAHGKFVYVSLSNGWTIGISFGMTGRIMSDTLEHAHHRLEFMTQSGRKVYYNDMRNFGTMYFWSPGSPDLQKKLKTLGPDLLASPNLTKSEVAKLFRVKKYKEKEITQAIMSQEVLAGAGNWMKSEALFATRISPYAKVSNLTDQDLYNLYNSLVDLAQIAYQYHQQNLTDDQPYKIVGTIWKVYMQNKYNQYKVLRVTNTKDKRTTHYVKELQTKGIPPTKTANE